MLLRKNKKLQPWQKEPRKTYRTFSVHILIADSQLSNMDVAEMSEDIDLSGDDEFVGTCYPRKLN